MFCFQMNLISQFGKEYTLRTFVTKQSTLQLFMSEHFMSFELVRIGNLFITNVTHNILRMRLFHMLHEPVAKVYAYYANKI